MIGTISVGATLTLDANGFQCRRSSVQNRSSAASSGVT